MSLERIVFAFVIVLALTLNFGFFVGDIDKPAHHNVYEFFAALVVNIVATIMKFGDRSQLGSTMLATSLAADVQLIAAAVVWVMASVGGGGELSSAAMVSIVSLAGGALVANIVSVVLLIIETASVRR